MLSSFGLRGKLNVRLWNLKDKTMGDKFVYIPIDEAQNYSFSRLQLVVWILNLMNQPIKIQLRSQIVKT